MFGALVISLESLKQGIHICCADWYWCVLCMRDTLLPKGICSGSRNLF